MTEGLGFRATPLTVVIWARVSPPSLPRPPRCGGGHSPGHPRAGGSAEALESAEEAHFAEVDAWTGEEGGYAHLHSTKPATLGAALHDSPAGLAAWIGEKITA